MDRVIKKDRKQDNFKLIVEETINWNFINEKKKDPKEWAKFEREAEKWAELTGALREIQGR